LYLQIFSFFVITTKTRPNKPQKVNGNTYRLIHIVKSHNTRTKQTGQRDGSDDSEEGEDENE